MHTQSRCVHRNGHAFATAAVVALSLALALAGPARVTAQEALPGAAPVSAGERGPGDEWVRFTLAEAGSPPVAWGASSVLEADTALRPSRYGPEKALDGDIATAWVEGVPGPGSRAGTNAPGEAYYLGTPEIPAALGFHNGYGQSERLFSMNYRVKELAVQIYAAVHVDVLSSEFATP
ncbi:MAG: hypothetical protein PF508_01780 [Spirochaeta sp.]|jgi:hypothetical protein|nr:hypothetical protein [Spirochaeta sp.]